MIEAPAPSPPGVESAQGSGRHSARRDGWSSAPELFVVAGIVAVAVAARLGPLGRGLGFDELFTAVHFVGAESAWKTASTAIDFNNHVAYSLLARLSVDVFGGSEWALRLPALLLGLFALPLLWQLARSVIGSGPALAATLLLALSPEHVLWSTSARGYSGLLLGVLLGTGLFFRLLARPRPGLAAAFAVTTALTAYFHLYAVPVALVQGGLLLAILSGLVRRPGPPPRAVRHEPPAHPGGLPLAPGSHAADPPGRPLSRGRERGAGGEGRLPAGGEGHPGAGPAAPRGAVLGLTALVGAALLTIVVYLPILPSLLASVRHAGRGVFWPGFPWSVAQELTAVTPDPLVVVFLVVAGVGAGWLGRRRPALVGYALAIVLVPLAAVTLARPLDLFARFFVYALPFLLVALVLGGLALTARLRRLIPSASLLAWAPAILGLAGLLWSWSVQYPAFLVDEGYRDATIALAFEAEEDTRLCAVGVNGELFQWYAARPLLLPKTVRELQQMTRGAAEIRCVGRPTSWESREAAELRRYLQERGTAGRYGDIVVYRLRRE